MQHYATRLTAATLTFIIGITTAALFNTNNLDAAARTSAEREVLTVEREYIRAHVERDIVALNEILAEDFRANFGRSITKDRRLALIANPFFTIKDISTEDVEVAVEADGDTATVKGRARMTIGYRDRDNDFTTPEYKFARLYKKIDGRWQVSVLSVSLKR